MSDAGNLSVSELLGRAAGGDGDAVDALFGHYRDRLRRMVAIHMDRRMAARVDASDVVQDALATASTRLADYFNGPAMPFYPWLRRIAWNRLVDAYRHHVVRQSRSLLREEPLGLNDDSVNALADQLMSSSVDPLRQLIRRELRERVTTTLKQLDPIDQEILLLRHLEQLPTAECAAVLDITVAAAKKRYVRAMGRLRDLLVPVDR
ncbi:MAG: sigma-70 family RNA polymerase sigma factor [Thermoguttaceae bacterium]